MAALDGIVVDNAVAAAAVVVVGVDVGFAVGGVAVPGAGGEADRGTDSSTRRHSQNTGPGANKTPMHWADGPEWLERTP